MVQVETGKELDCEIVCNNDRKATYRYVRYEISRLVRLIIDFLKILHFMSERKRRRASARQKDLKLKNRENTWFARLSRV